MLSGLETPVSGPTAIFDLKGRYELICYFGLESPVCIDLEELVCDSESLVSLRNRPPSFTFQACKCPYGVNVLWDDYALVMDLVDEVRLALSDVQYVLPVRDFPHVSPGSVHVSHHLCHSVHAVNSIRSSDGR